MFRHSSSFFFLLLLLRFLLASSFFRYSEFNFHGKRGTPCVVSLSALPKTGEKKRNASSLDCFVIIVLFSFQGLSNLLCLHSDSKFLSQFFFLLFWFSKTSVKCRMWKLYSLEDKRWRPLIGWMAGSPSTQQHGIREVYVLFLYKVHFSCQSLSSSLLLHSQNNRGHCFISWLELTTILNTF